MAAARAAGHDGVTAEQAASCPVVLLAVPVAALPDLLPRLAPHLRPGGLLVDVGSVKVLPAQLMQEHAPPGTGIVATHPMFGPRSLDLPGRRQVVVCPVRGPGWRRVAAFLLRAGMDPVVMGAEAHDREAALSQGLTHLLARALAGMGAGVPGLSTPSAALLWQGLGMVAGDAPAVGDTILNDNPHAGRLREDLIAALQRLAPPSRDCGA